MVVFIINHGSMLTSYLLAISIKLYFQSQIRPIKIIIIENTGPTTSHGLKNNSIHDFQPWCGVNTFNNYHFVNQNFIMGFMLNQLLLNRNYQLNIWSLDSIRFLPDNQTKDSYSYYSMDKPIPGQRERIEALLSNNKGGIAIIYHPILVVNGLRRLIFTSENDISIVTLTRGISQINQFVQEVCLNNPGQQIVMIDGKFGSKTCSNNGNQDFMIHSNLNEIHYTNKALSNSSSSNQGHALPFSILWLPKLRSKLSQSNDLMVKVDLTSFTGDQPVMCINLLSFTSNVMANEAISDLNIFHGLKTCDMILGAIHELISYGNIESNLSKF